MCHISFHFHSINGLWPQFTWAHLLNIKCGTEHIKFISWTQLFRFGFNQYFKPFYLHHSTNNREATASLCFVCGNSHYTLIHSLCCFIDCIAHKFIYIFEFIGWLIIFPFRLNNLLSSGIQVQCAHESN